MPLRTFSLSFWLRQSVALLAAMLLTTSALHAQFDQIYTFYANVNQTDGGEPVARLLAYGGALYGTTRYYGANGCGTVFQLTPDGNGTWTEALYSFAGGANDGCYPFAGLIVDANGNLYGTTNGGGSFGYGTVFKITPSGSDPTTWTESVLYSFGGPNGDGIYPQDSLVLDQGVLYGTTSEGGANNSGAIFRLTPSHSAKSSWKEDVLYSFCSLADCADGDHPLAELVEYNGEFYTTTEYGGQYELGTVFKLSPPAQGQKDWIPTVLHSFCSLQSPICPDGNRPVAGLIVDAKGTLYGTAYVGGSGTYGTVFKLTPPAQGQKDWTLSTIDAFSESHRGYPAATLVQDEQGALYGTTQGDGGSAQPGGEVFKLTPPLPHHVAWKETVLHTFQADGDGGYYPSAGLILYQGALYGTTRYGPSSVQYCDSFVSGFYGCGTVFTLSPSD